MNESRLGRKKLPSRREVLITIGSLAVAACGDEAPSAAPGATAGTGAADGNGQTGDSATASPTDAGKADAAAAVEADAGAKPPADVASIDAAAAEGIVNQALPTPAVTSNEKHYITSCCGTPAYDALTYKLQIFDTGKLMTAFSLAELEAITALDREHTLVCIGTSPWGQAIGNAVWTGLPLAKLLETRGLMVPKQPFIKISAFDGYTTGLPASDVSKPLWVVWRMNGQPLPAEHGFPVRLLVPGRYGMKNPKWMTAIDFVDAAYAGYWETKGWSDPAPYKPNTFIKYPTDESILKLGKTRVQGTAYAGSDPITKVDVRVDGGAWQAAVFDYNKGADIWALWHFDVALKAGKHKVQARCTTASGLMSSDKPEGSAPGDGAGYDGSMEVEFEVQA